MKEFGYQRFVKTKVDGKLVDVLRELPCRRATRNELSGFHGPDRGRKLIVTLTAGDLITFRPAGRGAGRVKSVSAFDVYDFVLRTEAAQIARQKREKKKEVVAARSLRAKIAREDKKLGRTLCERKLVIKALQTVKGQTAK